MECYLQYAQVTRQLSQKRPSIGGESEAEFSPNINLKQLWVAHKVKNNVAQI